MPPKLGSWIEYRRDWHKHHDLRMPEPENSGIKLKNIYPDIDEKRRDRDELRDANNRQ